MFVHNASCPQPSQKQCFQKAQQPHAHDACRHISQDTLAEWSKAPDSSSGGAIRVGSNPTGVIHSGPYPRKRWNVETCQAGLQTQSWLGPTGAGTPRTLLKVALAYRNRPGCAPSFRGPAWKQWRNEPVNRQHANESAVGRAGRLANVTAFFHAPLACTPAGPRTCPLATHMQAKGPAHLHDVFDCGPSFLIWF